MRVRIRVAAVLLPVLITAAVAASAAPGDSAPAPVQGGLASVPRPDHVVVVVEENHSGSSIIGNPDAPYINSLAVENANMSQSYALTHPSQPNYVALFSGSTQGITDDSCPHSFSTPNLGTSLAAAGLGFAGFSEGLPSTGSGVCGSGRYVRKHNPWVDFPAVPAAANRPWAAFPTDYSTLPEVSVVVPDLGNDMHDGTVAQGDAWLRSNLAGYVTWAKTHNSLFVLTFDEDDNHEGNRIPTILAGQQIRPGTYDETINHYNLLRTIEDAYGLPPVGASATSAPILDVWAAPAGDQPPVAAFTPSCVRTACSFDAAGSTDPDGTITAYRWNFGDGTTGSGPTPQHSYATGGTYTVSLTVVDDQNVGATAERAVTLADPPGAVFVNDTFGRTVAGDWGRADVGGVWSLSGGAAAFSVAPGTGSMRLARAGAVVGAAQGSVVRSDTDVTVGLTLDALPVGGPVYLTVQGRRVTGSEDYNARVFVNANGSVTIRATKRLSGVETLLAGPVTLGGFTYRAGAPLTVRVQVVGTSPSTVRARVWPSATAEPSSWQVSATDSTAGLQAGGSVGVQGYLSSAATNAPITVGVTSVTAKPTTAPAAVAPTAAFTAACVQLGCTFDGSGSSDADGTVTAWAWDFGDGTVGAGVRPVHSYVVGGIYTVTLTVTDDSGARSTVTRQVTATPPPANAAPVAAFTASCARLVCTVDGTSSSDDEGVEGWAWDFGDGSSGTGATVVHTFAASATYAVRLTVRDDDDATAEVTRPITVTAQAAPFVSDTFGRTVSGGWGNADVGGAWSGTSAAGGFTVVPGAGRLRLSSATVQSAYVGPARTDVDLVTTFAVDAVPVGGPLYPYVTGRRVGVGNEYDARLTLSNSQRVNLWLVRVEAGRETALTAEATVPGLTFAADTRLSVRVQVSGTSPTTVRARIWLAAATEPTTWNASVTDSAAALQASGTIGLRGYVSSRLSNAPVTLAVYDLLARPTA